MQQHQLEVMNFIAGMTGDENPNMTKIAPTVLNGTADLLTKSNGLWFYRFKGMDFVGCINISFKGRNIKQINATSLVDTGEIFVICDEIDAIGIDESSGWITCEGWEYTAPSE